MAIQAQQGVTTALWQPEQERKERDLKMEPSQTDLQVKTGSAAESSLKLAALQETRKFILNLMQLEKTLPKYEPKRREISKTARTASEYLKISQEVYKKYTKDLEAAKKNGNEQPNLLEMLFTALDTNGNDPLLTYIDSNNDFGASLLTYLYKQQYHAFQWRDDFNVVQFNNWEFYVRGNSNSFNDPSVDLPNLDTKKMDANLLSLHLDDKNWTKERFLVTYLPTLYMIMLQRFKITAVSKYTSRESDAVFLKKLGEYLFNLSNELTSFARNDPSSFISYVNASPLLFNIVLLTKDLFEVTCFNCVLEDVTKFVENPSYHKLLNRLLDQDKAWTNKLTELIYSSRRWSFSDRPDSHYLWSTNVLSTIERNSIAGIGKKFCEKTEEYQKIDKDLKELISKQNDIKKQCSIKDKEKQLKDSEDKYQKAKSEFDQQGNELLYKVRQLGDQIAKNNQMIEFTKSQRIGIDSLKIEQQKLEKEVLEISQKLTSKVDDTLMEKEIELLELELKSSKSVDDISKIDLLKKEIAKIQNTEQQLNNEESEKYLIQRELDEQQLSEKRAQLTFLKGKIDATEKDLAGKGLNSIPELQKKIEQINQQIKTEQERHEVFGKELNLLKIELENRKKALAEAESFVIQECRKLGLSEKTEQQQKLLDDHLRKFIDANRDALKQNCYTFLKIEVEDYIAKGNTKTTYFLGQ